MTKEAQMPYKPTVKKCIQCKKNDTTSRFCHDCAKMRRVNGLRDFGRGLVEKKEKYCFAWDEESVML